MILEINTTVKDFYLKYYTAMNGVLNLTNKQLQVLSEFSYIKFNIPKEYTEEQADKLTFSAASRTIVAKRLGISIYNLNNLVRSLREKGIFIKPKGKVNYHIINPSVYTPLDSTEKTVTFKFNLVNTNNQ